MQNLLIGFVIGVVLTAITLLTASVDGRSEANAFGGYDPSCPADITDVNQGAPDGMVDVFDLLLVLDQWGRCEPCVPDCAGVECGDDGCGGSCGTCGIGETCRNGICVPE